MLAGAECDGLDLAPATAGLRFAAEPARSQPGSAVAPEEPPVARAPAPAKIARGNNRHTRKFRGIRVRLRAATKAACVRPEKDRTRTEIRVLDNNILLRWATVFTKEASKGSRFFPREDEAHSGSGKSIERRQGSVIGKQVRSHAAADIMAKQTRAATAPAVKAEDCAFGAVGSDRHGRGCLRRRFPGAIFTGTYAVEHWCDPDSR